MNIDYILELWLENPPKYTSLFVKLALINLLIDCISGPLITGAQATGKIKWYQITIGSFILLCVPISYVLLKFYPQPEIVFLVIIIINLFALLFRVFFLNKIMDLDIKKFFIDVLFKIIMVSLPTLIFVYFLNDFLFLESNLWNLVLSTASISILNIVLVIFIGLENSEKQIIINLIKSKIK